MTYGSEWEKRIIGRELSSVVLSSDKEELKLSFKDGGTQSFTVSGDCCSHSWIEHISVPDDVSGARIVDVKHDDSVIEVHPEHDCLQVYQTHFVTDRGAITLEFRNSSNGYYGGSLDDAGHTDPG